jgi:hypothetical protein
MKIEISTDKGENWKTLFLRLPNNRHHIEFRTNGYSSSTPEIIRKMEAYLITNGATKVESFINDNTWNHSGVIEYTAPCRIGIPDSI